MMNLRERLAPCDVLISDGAILCERGGTGILQRGRHERGDPLDDLDPDTLTPPGTVRSLMVRPHEWYARRGCPTPTLGSDTTEIGRAHV